MQAAVAGVSYAADGRSLASGSADGVVMLWGWPGAAPPVVPRPWPGPGGAPQGLLAGEGAVVHTHAAAVAAVAFSPAGAPLASAAGAELALWSPRGRGAARHKARARSYYMRWMSSVALPGLGLRTPRLWAAGLAAAFSPKGAPPASVAGAALGWRGPNLLQPNPIISTHHHSAHIMRARSWPGGRWQLRGARAGGCSPSRWPAAASACAAAPARRPPRCARPAPWRPSRGARRGARADRLSPGCMPLRAWRALAGDGPARSMLAAHKARALRGKVVGRRDGVLAPARARSLCCEPCHATCGQFPRGSGKHARRRSGRRAARTRSRSPAPMACSGCTARAARPPARRGPWASGPPRFASPRAARPRRARPRGSCRPVRVI